MNRSLKPHSTGVLNKRGGCGLGASFAASLILAPLGDAVIGKMMAYTFAIQWLEVRVEDMTANNLRLRGIDRQTKAFVSAGSGTVIGMIEAVAKLRHQIVEKLDLLHLIVGETL